MELIRQAANSDGDYVIFQLIRKTEYNLFEVVMVNGRTGQELQIFCDVVDVGIPEQEHEEWNVRFDGENAFKRACDFMGIEIEGEDE